MSEDDHKLPTSLTPEVLFGALQAAASAMVITDRQGRILWVNPAWCALTGYSAAEVVGQTPRILKSGAHPPAFYKNLWDTILRGETWAGEIINRRKDGSLYIGQMTITPVHGPRGEITHFVAVKADISPHLQPVETIARQVEFLEVLNRLSALLTQSLTLAETLSRSLQTLLSVSFLRVLDKGAIFLRLPGEEMLELACAHNLPPGLQAACRHVAFGYCLCGRAAARGEMQFADCVDERHETRYEGISPHGHYSVPLVNEGEVIGVVTMYLPHGHKMNVLERQFLQSAAQVLAGVIARRQDEKNLRESEEKFRKLVELSPDLIALHSGGQVLYVNPAGAALIGAESPDELIGQPVLNFVVPEMRSRIAGRIRHALETGEPLPPLREQFLRQDGSRVDVLVSAVPTIWKGEAAVLVIARDLTAQLQMQAALAATEARYRRLFEEINDVVFRTDAEGRVVEVSPSLYRRYGYSPEEVLGRHVADFYHDPQGYKQLLAALGQEGEVNDFEIVMRGSDGAPIYTSITCRLVRDEEGQPMGVEGVLRDITRRKQAEVELLSAKRALEQAQQRLQQALRHEQYLAQTDELTGLWNRRYFFEQGGREFAVARRYHRPLSILMFDLDNFKQINDSCGHLFGDEALARLARVVSAHLREADLPARYGGDEFAVLLPHTGLEQALVLAQRLRQAVSAMRLQAEKKEVVLSLSIGVAEISHQPPDERIENVIQRADDALYLAKSSGGDCVAVARVSDGDWKCELV